MNVLQWSHHSWSSCCRLPWVQKARLGWRGLGLELNSVLQRRAASNAVIVSVVMPYLLVLLSGFICFYPARCCWAVFVLSPLSCFRRVPQLSLKTSSCMGGRKEERFTWCISHFTVTSGCSQSYSPVLFTDSSCLCSLWYW